MAADNGVVTLNILTSGIRPGGHMNIQSLGAAPVATTWSGQVPANGTASTGPLPATKASAPVANVQAPPQQPTLDQVTQAVSRLQEALAPLSQELQLSVDKDSGDTVIKIIDTASKKIVRQFPSEEILNLAKSLGNYQQGLLVEHKV